MSTWIWLHRRNDRATRKINARDGRHGHEEHSAKMFRAVFNKWCNWANDPATAVQLFGIDAVREFEKFPRWMATVSISESKNDPAYLTKLWCGLPSLVTGSGDIQSNGKNLMAEISCDDLIEHARYMLAFRPFVHMFDSTHRWEIILPTDREPDQPISLPCYDANMKMAGI